MNRAKTYFLCPTWDCPPDGPIFLGSIIDDPLEPETSLNEDETMYTRARDKIRLL